MSLCNSFGSQLICVVYDVQSWQSKQHEGVCFTTQDGLTGSAWGDWANYTASPLRWGRDRCRDALEEKRLRRVRATTNKSSKWAIRHLSALVLLLMWLDFHLHHVFKGFVHRIHRIKGFLDSWFVNFRTPSMHGFQSCCPSEPAGSSSRLKPF